jgi:hypothetical protein
MTDEAIRSRSHGDVLVLVGPGPWPGPGESCGTRMLRRAPAGGSSPGTFWRRPAGSVRVNAQGAGTAPGWAASESFVLRGGPPARGSCGSVRGVLDQPAAGRQYPGDWVSRSSSRSAASTPPGGSGWASESDFLYQKPLRDSSNWKRGMP